VAFENPSWPTFRGVSVAVLGDAYVVAAAAGAYVAGAFAAVAAGAFAAAVAAGAFLGEKVEDRTDSRRVVVVVAACRVETENSVVVEEVDIQIATVGD
jgi:hypothetical protein